MKNRFYFSIAIASLNLMIALSFSGYAQKPGKGDKTERPTSPYALKCAAYKGGDVQSTVKLTNTGKAIPANMAIKVKTPGGIENVTFNDVFQSNATREAHGAAGNSGPCSAWVVAQ